MKTLYDLNHDYLRYILTYNPINGHFYWNVRKSSKTKVGDRAGVLHPNGYIYIRIDGFGYRAHRLAWFYVYKSWPELEIDHIDRIKTNNGILNLRDVTSKVNQSNKAKKEGVKKYKIKKIKFNQESFLEGYKI